jgi:hypothetical protein
MAECDFGTSWRGEFAGTSTRLCVDPDHRCWVWFEGERALDRSAIEGWLAGSHTDARSGRAATAGEIFGGLYLWLALHDSRFIQLGAPGTTEIPCLLALPGKLAQTAGLLDDAGLAIITPGATTPATALADPRALELTIRGFARAGPLVRALIDLIGAWDDAGRPGTADLRVIAYPRGGEYRPSPGEFVLDKRWSRLVLAR